MTTTKNEPKPSLIVIMVSRTGCLYNKQALECRNLILCQRIVVLLHHRNVKENTNKSHHLLYLWQQEKTNPPRPPTVFMTTLNKR